MYLLPPLPPFWRPFSLSCLILALLGAILALSGPILSPSCSKMAPRWPNITQPNAKMSQHSLQGQPQDPKKTFKSAILSLFFWFSQFLARSRPRSKKGRQDAPKSAPSWPSWPPSWPSWAHLGTKLANLAHLGAKMRPNSYLVWSPRCAPNRILGQLGAKRVT